MTERLHFHFSLSCIGERNGNSLQYSYLENPRDGGAWWAAVSGAAQSWTRLKQLSGSSSNSLETELWNIVPLDMTFDLTQVHKFIKFLNLSKSSLSIKYYACMYSFHLVVFEC